MIGLTLKSIKIFIEEISKEKHDEPVPSFESINHKKFSSALKTPFLRPIPENEDQEYIFNVSAHLFCLIIESHAAPNANKRLAVMSLISILSINGYALKTSSVRLYAIAMAVTWLSKYGHFEGAINEVTDFIKNETEHTGFGNKFPGDKDKLEAEFIQFMQSRD